MLGAAHDHRMRYQAAHGRRCVQLRLRVGESIEPDWLLDERTRDAGHRGVAQARRVLREATANDSPADRRRGDANAGAEA